MEVGKKNQRLTERNMIGPVGQRRRVGDAMVDSGVAKAQGRTGRGGSSTRGCSPRASPDFGVGGPGRGEVGER
jgi:hypothetical protein